MAKKLNLKADWINEETLRISWMDVKANDNNKAAMIILPIVIFVLFIVSAGVALSDGGFGFMGLVLIGTLVSVTWFRSGSTSVPNHIDFSAKDISHKGQKFPTHEVSRFEYGLKSALTGVTPPRDGNGNSMSDPLLIRMWINDAFPHEISSNNWQVQINHEIRDALAKALDAVRNVEKKQSQAKEFGEVNGDFGMPDY